MTAVIQMKPEGRYSNPDLERLVIEMSEVVKQKEVMHAKEAADFIGVSERQIYRIPNIPSHKVSGVGRVFLRDELIDFIRNHKK